MVRDVIDALTICAWSGILAGLTGFFGRAIALVISSFVHYIVGDAEVMSWRGCRWQ